MSETYNSQKEPDDYTMSRPYKFLKTMPFSKFLMLIFIFFIAVYAMFLVLIKKSEYENLDSLPRFEYTRDEKDYSIWPDYLNFLNSDIQKMLKNNRILIKEECLKELDNKKLSIEILDKALGYWSKSNQPECSFFYQMFTQIYQVKFKQNHLNLNDKFIEKVKKMLNNDSNLVNSVYNQVKI